MTWDYTYDAGGWENFESVAQTPDGGYAGVGSNYLLRLDAAGNVLWAIHFGAQLTSVKNTADGGFVVSGYTGNNALLAKTDSFGNLIWQQQYSKGSRVKTNTVQETQDGSYIASGNANIGGTKGDEVYLLKTDAFGNPLWDRTFGGIDSDFDGENDESLQQTSDGGYIIAGSTWSYGYRNYTSDVYLIKTDAYGNLKWQRNYGSNRTDLGTAVQQTSDGGYIVAGTYGYSSTDDDAYLVRTDSLGNVLWQRTYGGTQSDRAYSVQVTNDGGYVLAGMYRFSNTDFDFYVVKTNASGFIEWQQAIGGSLGELAFCIQQTFDGGYIVGGYTESFAATSRDFYLVKLGYAAATTAQDQGVESKEIPLDRAHKELAASWEQ